MHAYSLLAGADVASENPSLLIIQPVLTNCQPKNGGYSMVR